jgi:hypothetical protein
MPNKNFTIYSLIFALILTSGPTTVFSSEFSSETEVAEQKGPKSLKRLHGSKVDVATVGGKVHTLRGTAISNAQIGLYNADTDQWVYARTGSFGQYAFHNLPTSDFYVIVVIHKRHLFLDGSRTFTLEGNMFNVNFIASPIE